LRTANVYVHDGSAFMAKVDLKRCRASVRDRDGWRDGQCGRRPVVTAANLGWCTQHSPKAIAERDAQRDARDAKVRRKWTMEAVGAAWVAAMERTEDPAAAQAAALRVWTARQE